ncbi:MULTISPECIES: hypothetical protein [unclassified Streptosporangium]|uniref:hypothetical protein n=1 Tax=unclassified Streptosporangium TaxID=2632669 RepID=UPI002E2BCD18|nr:MULTISPECIES: hypothetical protein [unclassified Streptosporangium]
MTDSPDEYGELLRRALSAEANSVVPSPDGLEIIRGRIERRGLRWLVWWRAGASVAGAVLVAATVVMVVPQFREQVIPRVSTEGVKYAESTPPVDGSATSRPPASNSQPPSNHAPLPAVSRSGPGATMLPPTPTPSRSARPSTRPTSRSNPATTAPRPTPTPTPTCPTPLDSPTLEPGGITRRCEEIEATPTPTKTRTRPPASSESPCSPDECAPSGDVSPPVPTEAGTPVPTPIQN